MGHPLSKKLQLLSRILFLDRHDQLLSEEVRGWSPRRVLSIYRRIVDPTAVDSEVLVIRLTSFPLLAGVWLAGAFVFTRTVALTPGQAWFVMLLLLAAGTMIIGRSVLHSFWLAARLNFSLCAFRFRLGKTIGSMGPRFVAGAVSPLVAGLFMTLTLLVAGTILAIPLSQSLDDMFNVGIWRSSDESFRNRVVRFATRGPFRVIDLAGSEINGFRLDASSVGRLPGSMDFSFQGLLVRPGSTFTNCALVEFQNVAINHVTFEECSFDTVILENVALQDVFFDGIRDSDVVFQDCELESVTFALDGASRIGFSECTFDNVMIRNRAQGGMSRPLLKFDGGSGEILRDVRL